MCRYIVAAIEAAKKIIGYIVTVTEAEQEMYRFHRYCYCGYRSHRNLSREWKPQEQQPRGKLPWEQKARKAQQPRKKQPQNEQPRQGSHVSIRWSSSRRSSSLRRSSHESRHGSHLERRSPDCLIAPEGVAITVAAAKEAAVTEAAEREHGPRKQQPQKEQPLNRRPREQQQLLSSHWSSSSRSSSP
jgi:hypothetical protein